VNAHVIDAFDEIILAFFKTRDFLADAMLQAAVDRHSTQQPARVSLALRPIWSKRLDFRMIDVPAQDVAQAYDICVRKVVQTIDFAVVCVDTT